MILTLYKRTVQYLFNVAESQVGGRFFFKEVLVWPKVGVDS